MTYKLLFVKNRTTEPDNLNTDWFKANTPIDVQIIDRISTDFDVTTKLIGNSTFKGAICGDDIVAKLKTVVLEGKYNAVVWYCGNSLNGVRVSSVNGGGSAPLYPDTEIIQLRTISDGGRDLNHELFHAFFFKANKGTNPANIVDPMDSYIQDSNWVVDSVINTNREIALQRLAPFWNKIIGLPMLNYKYFKPSEIIGLKPELVALLDQARGIAGIPFKITSGLRSPSQNALVGGVPTSAHLTGEAVDLLCTDASSRYKILTALLKVGFNRIEIAKSHIHCDISKTLAQNICDFSNDN